MDGLTGQFLTGQLLWRLQIETVVGWADWTVFDGTTVMETANGNGCSLLVGWADCCLGIVWGTHEGDQQL